MQPFITNITQKGQITLPKEIREILGLQPKSRVSIAVTKEGQLKVKKVVSLLDLAGSIKPIPGKSVLDSRKAMETSYEPR